MGTFPLLLLACALRGTQSQPQTQLVKKTARAVLVGDYKLVQQVIRPNATPIPPCTNPPFATVDANLAHTGDDPFLSIQEQFNQEIYNDLFQLIPLYKESGGFSTFRFDDFLDKRVRRLLPSMRRILFRATAPSLLGQKLSELEPIADKLKETNDWTKAFGTRACRLAPSSSSGTPFKFPSMSGTLLGCPPYDNSNAVADLENALPAVALEDSSATVEQTAKLVCSMICAFQKWPEWSSRLASERSKALNGLSPEAPIDREVLSKMPELRAFALECLRIESPAHPAPLRLDDDVKVGESELRKGTIITPDPSLAHMSVENHRNPEAFEPDRYLAESAEVAPSFGFSGEVVSPLIRPEWPGAPVAPGVVGVSLAIDVSCAAFVQVQRMFEVRVSSDMLSTGKASWSEDLEVLCKPAMYYELQRGVRQLKF